MQNARRKMLGKKFVMPVLMLVFGILLSSTQTNAQQTSDSAELTQRIRVANQRINKVLADNEELRELVATQDRLIAAQDVKSDAQATVIQKMKAENEALKMENAAQKVQIAELAKVRCDKNIFLFGLIKSIKCR